MPSPLLAKTVALMALLAVVSCQCKNDKFCLECSNDVCVRCAYGYPGSNGICQKSANIYRGCYIYGSNTICLECQNGYYQNILTSGNNTCTPLNETVSEYCAYSTLGINSCSACKGGVLQNGGGCTPGPKCADPNCESCYYDLTTGNQYCRMCKQGFSQWIGVNPPVCVETPELPLCERFYTRNWCARCAPGSYYSSGRCLPADETNFGSARSLSILSVVALIMAAFHN